MSKMRYAVVKTIPGHPVGRTAHPSHGRSAPESEVVMSRHSRLDLAERAMRRHERQHNSNVTFRVDDED
jgi:hypothetical protein